MPHRLTLQAVASHIRGSAFRTHCRARTEVFETANVFAVVRVFEGFFSWLFV